MVEQLRDKGMEIDLFARSQPAAQTAEILAKALGIKLKKLDRLQNLNQGLWQGMLVEDVRHKQPKVYRQWQEQPENVCPPEGEMLSEADDRVRTAIDQTVEASQGRRDRAGRARAAAEPRPPLHQPRRIGRFVEGAQRPRTVRGPRTSSPTKCSPRACDQRG